MKRVHSAVDRFGIFLLIGVFTLCYSVISVTKYLHFQTGLDLAIYVQSFWFYLHELLPRVTLYPSYGDLVWADHFSPSLMLLSPFMALWGDPRMLLILQSLLVCAGAYPIYRTAITLLKNVYLSLAIACTYLLFFGVQHAVTFDFHVATIASSVLPWILWSLVIKKWSWLVILSIIFSGFKEDASIYIVGIGLYLIASRIHWKLGVVLVSVFGLYAYLVSTIIMPSFAQSIAKTYENPEIPRTLQELGSLFFGTTTKVRTIVLSFISFGFLPIFSGWFLILPIIHFVINFIGDHAGRTDIFLHYRSYLGSLLGFGTIFGIQYIQKHYPRVFRYRYTMYALSALLIGNTFAWDFVLHLPINTLTKKQFYERQSWMDDIEFALATLPKDSSVITLNSIVSRVSFREYVSLYPDHFGDAEYVLLDTRPNQPLVNYLFTSRSEESFQQMMKEAREDSRYEIESQHGYVYVLKKRGIE